MYYCNLSSIVKWGLTLLVLTASGFASAHTETGVTGGLISGILHPVSGLDHLVAMVAVGLWGAQLQRPAIWLLPITFPAMMSVGGLMGIAGLPVPAVEIGIGLSALALGMMVTLNARPPLWAAIPMVGFFAIFHGYAHGAELPSAANPLAYGVGFVVATGLLHLAGILLGALLQWPAGQKAVRGLGGVIAVLGAYFSVSAFGLIA